MLLRAYIFRGRPVFSPFPRLAAEVCVYQEAACLRGEAAAGPLLHVQKHRFNIDTTHRVHLVCCQERKHELTINSTN